MSRKTCKKETCICEKKIGERIKHFLPELERLVKAPRKERAQILKKADTCLARLLCESGMNVLKGNVTLKNDQYQRLKPHKRLLLLVSEPTIPLDKRRKALEEKKGGFLPIILPALISAISGLAGQSLSNIISG